LSAITETPVPDNNPSEHFSNALETAVRIGDDCDTVAAIAGSLLGARWGSDAIPNNWKSIIHGRREQISESINYEALMMLTEKALL
jgi:ADP-ribosyl-[dinitrogen reductase] hydrolase